ncbi:MAG: hypothetical protein PWQ20_651 [Thermotogaceae bacterium]|jgi:predicted short-subunit dehydrogenase-like oxidoreductase (DUF2520 family)|nr:hypothetical protein [Thermotogaceae bacterium]MDN5337581.1 hypothetical protein [Thermotogaceae bacterium]
MFLLNVLGAGRVGKTLAKTLKIAGWKIGIVANRTIESSKSAVKFIGEGKPTTTNFAESPRGILLICLPDDELENLNTILKNWSLRGLESIIHTSGAISSRVFDKVTNLSKNIGKASLHPIRAFADPEKNFSKIEKTYFGIEGNEKGIQTALKIVDSLKGIPVNIPSELKPLYHLSAVFASNFLVGLFWIADVLYSRCEMPESVSKEIIISLMNSSLENLSELEPKKALTGPVARRDWNLIKSERETLKSEVPEFISFFDEGIKLLKKLSGGINYGYKQDSSI